MSRAEMAALRQDEQRAAAAVVGVSDVRFLGHPDGMVEATLELRRDISRVIRQVRPERVLTQSPERNWEFIFASHPDHLATGEAAVCAVYPDARNPFAHPELLDDEGLEPWTVPELWIMGPGGQQAGVAVDTTATVERKVAALDVPQEPAARSRRRGAAGPRRGRGNAERPGSPRAAPPSCSGSSAFPERHGRRRPLVAGAARGLRGPRRHRRAIARHRRRPDGRADRPGRRHPVRPPSGRHGGARRHGRADERARGPRRGWPTSARCCARPSKPAGPCSASASAPSSWPPRSVRR